MSASEPKADVRTESRSLTSRNGDFRAESGHSSGIFWPSNECLKVAESGRCDTGLSMNVASASSTLGGLMKVASSYVRHRKS